MVLIKTLLLQGIAGKIKVFQPSKLILRKGIITYQNNEKNQNQISNKSRSDSCSPSCERSSFVHSISACVTLQVCGIKMIIKLKLQFLESSNIYINNILGGIWQQGTGWGQKQLTKIFPDSTLNFLILLRNAKIICFRNDCFPFSSAISIQIYSQLNVRLRCIFGIKWSNIKEILQVMEKIWGQKRGGHLFHCTFL